MCNSLGKTSIIYRVRVDGGCRGRSMKRWLVLSGAEMVGSAESTTFAWSVVGAASKLSSRPTGNVCEERTGMARRYTAAD